MMMPGFTAEVTLYRTRGYYRMAGICGALTDSQQLSPQVLDWPCYRKCRRMGYLPQFCFEACWRPTLA
jgi:hypothetical protein